MAPKQYSCHNASPVEEIIDVVHQTLLAIEFDLCSFNSITEQVGYRSKKVPEIGLLASRAATRQGI